MKLGTQFHLHGLVASRSWDSEGENRMVVELQDGRRISMLECHCHQDCVPAMVKCDKCGFEYPLTDLKTLKARCEALGVRPLVYSVLDFFRFRDELEEKGCSIDQILEGL